eukprot:28229-Prorocentrum_lima.AAC.1
MKKMERRTIEVNGVLQRLKEDVEGQDQRLDFLSDQMDQLEKNVSHGLSTQAYRPPAPATPQ